MSVKFKIGDEVVLLTSAIPDIPRYAVGTVVYVGETLYGIDFESCPLPELSPWWTNKGWLVTPEEIDHV